MRVCATLSWPWKSPCNVNLHSVAVFMSYGKVSGPEDKFLPVMGPSTHRKPTWWPGAGKSSLHGKKCLCGEACGEVWPAAECSLSAYCIQWRPAGPGAPAERKAEAGTHPASLWVPPCGRSKSSWSSEPCKVSKAAQEAEPPRLLAARWGPAAFSCGGGLTPWSGRLVWWLQCSAPLPWRSPRTKGSSQRTPYTHQRCCTWCGKGQMFPISCESCRQKAPGSHWWRGPVGL